MKDKIFIDTNILIYCYHDLNPEKRDKSRNLINKFDEVIISTQVLNEFANAFHKKLKAEWRDITISLQEILSNFSITTNSQITTLKACRISEKYKISFYDGLILASALENNCTILFSEDMQNGQRFEDKLIIINPFLGD